MCHGHHAIAFALAVSARPATWSLKKPTLTAFKTFPIVLASALMVWQGKAKPTSSFASFSSCQDLPVLACCPFILNAWRNVQNTKKKRCIYTSETTGRQKPKECIIIHRICTLDGLKNNYIYLQQNGLNSVTKLFAFFFFTFLYALSIFNSL